MLAQLHRRLARIPKSAGSEAYFFLDTRIISVLFFGPQTARDGTSKIWPELLEEDAVNPSG